MEIGKRHLRDVGMADCRNLKVRVEPVWMSAALKGGLHPIVNSRRMSRQDWKFGVVRGVVPSHFPRYSRLNYVGNGLCPLRTKDNRLHHHRADSWQTSSSGIREAKCHVVLIGDCHRLMGVCSIRRHRQSGIRLLLYYYLDQPRRLSRNPEKRSGCRRWRTVSGSRNLHKFRDRSGKWRRKYVKCHVGPRPRDEHAVRVGWESATTEEKREWEDWVNEVLYRRAGQWRFTVIKGKIPEMSPFRRTRLHSLCYAERTAAGGVSR